MSKIWVCAAMPVVFAAHFAMAGASASDSDLAQAQGMLSQLPPSCSRSGMYTEADGSVVVSIKCDGSGQAMSGLFRIKDGTVTPIR